MWVVVIVSVVVAAFIAWRVFLAVRGRGPERPVDSGHPHLTDVDPHTDT